MRAQGATNRRGRPRYPAPMLASARARVVGPEGAPGSEPSNRARSQPRR